MVVVESIISDFTSVFTFYMRCISFVSPLCLKIFWASFLITFLSPEIAMSIVRHVPFPLSQIMDVRFNVRDGAVGLNLLKLLLLLVVVEVVVVVLHDSKFHKHILLLFLLYT